MADLEKVIKGLESHRERTVCVNEEGEVCPYFSYEDCHRRLTDDALELLKAHALYSDALEILKVQRPTVDAVPVVRCKDCKWFRDSNGIDGFCYCDRIYRRCGTHWFCADGERKTDNANGA